MKIITGSTGKKHITSNNDGEFNQGIFGSGLIVLGNGEQLDAAIVDNNTIRIKDGDIVMQGRHALLEPGTVEDITISTGSVGKNRIDLIVARYQMDVVTGYESITLEVLEGEESSGEAIAPQYTTGVIRTGSLIAEHPLYQVNIEGINITNITKLFDVTDDLLGRIQKNEKAIEQTNSNLARNVIYKFEQSITAASKVNVSPTNIINSYGIIPITLNNGVFTINEDCTLNIVVNIIFCNFSFRDIIYFIVNNTEKMRIQSALSVGTYTDSFKEKTLGLPIKWYFRKGDTFTIAVYSENSQTIISTLNIY